MTRLWTYQVLPTPVGNLVAAATPDGLVSVAFLRPQHHGTDPLTAVLTQLSEHLGGPPQKTPSVLPQLKSQLDDWFAGQRATFSLPLDWSLAPQGFARKALEVTATIGWGETLSYAEVAREAGSPGAARAVGTAMSRNVFALVIPCHRVVAAGGKLGGYMGNDADGLAFKRQLLAREGITLR